MRRALLRYCAAAALAIDRRLQPLSDPHDGVYDRRFPTPMFSARLVSAVLAFAAFVYTLSLTTTLPPPPLDDPRAHLAAAAIYVAPSPAAETAPVADAAPLNGTHVRLADGTELVYQRPRAAPRGLVLLFHGCHHSATDFFPPAPGCPACIGLPEELRLVRHVLARNLTPLAVSSTNRRSKCWATNAHAPHGLDYTRVDAALRFARRNALLARADAHGERPVFAVGASSGGYFATSLYTRFQIAAVCPIVAPSVAHSRLPDAAVAAPDPAAATPLSPPPPPPHAFVHMPDRDARPAAAVARDVAALRAHAVPVTELRVGRHAVTPAYLAEAVPAWRLPLAAEVVAALRDAGHLDAQGQLEKDPRFSQWRKAVEKLRARLHDALLPDASPLSEELNRAWGAHEITADFFPDVLDFFEAHGRRPRANAQ